MKNNRPLFRPLELTGRAIILLGLLLPVALYGNPDLSKIREGDIIFQETQSRQALALQLATKSRYTHVGFVFKKQSRFFVLEAVQPVRIVSLDAFIANGVSRHFVVKRIRNAGQILTPETMDTMKRYGFGFLGRNYDLYFGWSDERIYCSELVWKIYQSVVGVEVGRLQRLRDFDLSHPHVRKLLKERYGDGIPYDEKVISVSEMFDAPNLVTVLQHP